MRRNEEQRARLKTAEWQAKIICQFIGAQAWIDTDKTGGRNPLVDAAMEIDIFGGRSERDILLDQIRGEKVADRAEDDPRISKVAADPKAGVEAANPSGSFEAMLRMFSGGARPAMDTDIAKSNGGGGE
jgi:hypothetical protein